MSRIAFSLLLVLLLPLQGYAAMTQCAAARAAQEARHPCGSNTADIHRHKCGTCCATAIAPAYSPWAPSLRTPAVSPPAVLSPPPIILLDRLDRPPRS